MLSGNPDQWRLMEVHILGLGAGKGTDAQSKRPPSARSTIGLNS
jgi:hypothetical protein